MNSLIRFVAIGFGCGYAPYFPGTVGSVVAVFIAYLYQFQLWQIAIFCLVGIFICGRAETILQEHDSSHIVFDEFCGMFIAAWQLANPMALIVAFILFRFFDIVKPYPINKLQSLPGGWGVMADDITAGVAARVLVWLVF
ncbi:MAG: phosphatidylglycerophosphatase A [Firmicutes bacterium HGW-Firmicutes-12]|jgi:phosphatidylglycerophosphatase A|nr:MAG: phosphatidylglycerophosphatase A [Firmicutes bacterium HGW-Firmicutes-12]